MTVSSGLCVECQNEVGAFEVDGTEERWGYRCIRNVLEFFTLMTLDDLIRRIRQEADGPVE